MALQDLDPGYDGVIPSDWLATFEAAALRLLGTRMRDAFTHAYTPELDDSDYRFPDTSGCRHVY